MSTKKATELHSLTLKVKNVEEFKEGYENIFLDLSKEMKMPFEVKPVKVILDTVTGNCGMYVLRNPKIPGYRMNDFVFNVAKEMKIKFGLSTILLNRKQAYVDPENVPETIDVDAKEVMEIIKRAQEDELFSDKYKEYVSRKKTAAEIDDAIDKRACAYAEKMASLKKNEDSDNSDDTTAAATATVTTTPAITASTVSEVDSEIASDVTISEIKFSIEKNGQLCLVF